MSSLIMLFCNDKGLDHIARGKGGGIFLPVSPSQLTCYHRESCCVITYGCLLDDFAFFFSFFFFDFTANYYINLTYSCREFFTLV